MSCQVSRTVHPLWVKMFTEQWYHTLAYCRCNVLHKSQNSNWSEYSRVTNWLVPPQLLDLPPPRQKLLTYSNLSQQNPIKGLQWRLLPTILFHQKVLLPTQTSWNVSYQLDIWCLQGLLQTHEVIWWLTVWGYQKVGYLQGMSEFSHFG